MSNNLTVNYVFDAKQHDPDAGFEPVPAGVYNVTVTGTSIENMKDDKGQGFKVEFTVADGEYAGRKLFNNYNLWHKLSQQTVEIAHKQLSALCHVTNVFQVNMNDAGAALRGARLRVQVGNDGKYNDVKGVFDVNNNKPARNGGAMNSGAPAATAQPTGGFGAPAQQPVAVAQPAYAAPAQQPMQPAQAPAAAPQQPAQQPGFPPFAGAQPAPAAVQPAPAQANWQQQPAAAPAQAAPAGTPPQAPWGQPAA